MAKILVGSLSRGLFGAVLMAVFMVGAGAAEVVDRVVAVVNDEVISLSEVEMMAKSLQAQPGVGSLGSGEALRRQMLEALIDQKLARAEAKRRGIEVTDKEVAEALEDFKKQNHLPDDAALAQALAKAGMTMNELKQRITDQLIRERLMMMTVGSKVTLTDEEMRRFYEQEYPKTGAGSQVHLQIVPMLYPPGATPEQKDETRKKAEIILKEYQQGVSLDELRRRHSLPMQDLGFIAESDLDRNLAQFLQQLKPGQVGPIETPQGFQLVQVVERRGGTPKSFEEAQPEIRRILMHKKLGEQFSEYVKTLRDKAHIKIMM
ncbi:MAG: SurA N-terminal domain-containing protein [Deltaproteobacteria bacterium]|nr:SurA N-terminal domain-containing protein [Deltaproteobacteria bacterium]